MTALPAPFIAPSRNQWAWETLVFVWQGRDLFVPGITTIPDGEIEDDYDVKEAQGQKGASTDKKGEKVKKFTTNHWLSDAPWTPGTYEPVEGVDVVDDHVQWTAFQFVLRQVMTSEPPKALSLKHPKLRLLEISSAVPTKINGPNPNEDGSTEFAISWLVYAPVKRTGGPGKDSPEGKSDSDERIDSRVEEIDKLQEEWDNL